MGLHEHPEFIEARLNHRKWFALLYGSALFLVFIFEFVPISVPIHRTPRNTMTLNLFSWDKSQSDPELYFSYQRSTIPRHTDNAYEYLTIKGGIKYTPPANSKLISPMFCREYWLTSKSRPPNMKSRFDAAIEHVDDVREASFLKWHFDKATSPGQILWFGISRNAVVLGIIVLLGKSVASSNRASNELLAVKLAIQKASCVCGYSLVGLTTKICPECGRNVISQPTPPAPTMSP